MKLHESVTVPFHTILVHEFMLYSGKSYADLAKALQVDEDYAIALCDGSRKPDANDIGNLAAFLNVSTIFVENLL